MALLSANSHSIPDLSLYNIYDQAVWTTNGHKWKFEVHWRKDPGERGTRPLPGAAPEKLNLVYCDRRVVKLFRDDANRPNWEPWGVYLAAQPLMIRSPYERVVAIRGAGGLGEHWDTVFYGFSGRQMNFIGRAPSQNANGPVNWRGREDQWLFDDYDRYQPDQPVTKRLLFHVRKGWAMNLVKSWTSSKPVKLVVTVHRERP